MCLFYPHLQYPCINIKNSKLDFCHKTMYLHMCPKRTSQHLPKFAIPTYKFAKEGLVFCEENAILVFRSTIKYVLTYMFVALDISYSDIAFWGWVLN